MLEIIQQFGKKREAAPFGYGRRRIDVAVLFLSLRAGRTMTAGDRV